MNDVVNEMLNDASKKRDRIKLIHVDDIVPNHKNKDYPMCDIETLALSLRICGQITPCIVVCDGDQYKLISGERRWRATKYNLVHGLSNTDELACIVRDYENDEEKILIAANGVRESIPVKDKLKITETVLAHYYSAKEANEIPVGTKKREWIAAITGYSERSIQSYLNKLSETKEDIETKEKSSLFLNNLKTRISKKIGAKTKVTEKYVQFNYSDIDDLNRILEILGLLEESANDGID
ncbi:MAG: ParB N-terminal domain-containing protein [Erysipelotrichaceae bacterium]|nr:ParB N-terminal domain-containing protein [Erysipelotrichaceae bacterium]